MFCRPAALSKKRVRRRCFTANFTKILKTTLFIEHLSWLLLQKLFKCFIIKISLISKQHLANLELVAWVCVTPNILINSKDSLFFLLLSSFVGLSFLFVFHLHHLQLASYNRFAKVQ